MKKLIYILLLSFLILTTSCLPNKAETVKDKMKKDGYTVEIYTKDKFNLDMMEKDFGYTNLNTVINVFKFTEERIDEYVNILIFDNKESAKAAYNKINEQKDHGEIKDETLEEIKIKGTWVYYGTKSTIKKLEK